MAETLTIARPYAQAAFLYANTHHALGEWSEMLGLLAAAWVWVLAVHIDGTGLTPDATASMVSLSAGALAANILSVIMLLVETVMFRR